jgi:hypothetical protein
LSVTNDGVVSLQGIMDYFSWTYVSSIDNPTAYTTLTEYTLTRTNGALNLANCMTYETPDGARVAEGTATFASSGNAFVSWQYNGFGDNMRYETFVVNYLAGGVVKEDMVNVADILIYPNPTSGVLNLSEELSNVQLFDVTGRQVYSASAVVSTLDLSEIVAGTYFLVGEKNGERVSVKVIKN